MSSSSRTPNPRQQAQQAQQDFIAKIRYSNALPAPANPPKLLNIPNNALENYCEVDFTSRLAREYMNNVEADVEGGMPLDIWGLPGVFDNDETAMNAYDNPPPVHPDDKALLLPLSQIGKKSVLPTGPGTPVSFLRRTEYISVRHKTKFAPSPHKPNNPDTQIDDEEARAKETDPVRMLAAIMRGFDIAHPDTVGETKYAEDDPQMAAAEENWNKIKPGYRDPKAARYVEEVIPFFPDAGAAADIGYMSIKFNVPPLQNDSKVRDNRTDVGLFKVNERGNGPTFDYYVPDSKDAVPAIQQAFSENPPPEILSTIGTPDAPITYARVREYETAQTANTLHHLQPDISDFALVYRDASAAGPRGFYWSPITQRMVLRAKRNEKIMKSIYSGIAPVHEEEEEKAELIRVTIRELNADEKRLRGEEVDEEGPSQSQGRGKEDDAEGEMEDADAGEEEEDDEEDDD